VRKSWAPFGRPDIERDPNALVRCGIPMVESAPEQRCPSVKKLDFLPRIESLRGVAALTVVGYHVGHLFDDLPATSAVDAFAYRMFMGVANGIGAVVAFFVLSGFVLARSLEANPDWVRYFRNRVFRLFPAAIAVVSLLVALYLMFGIYVGFKASFDPFNIVLNMLMIRSDINSPMWSMTVECFATPLILTSVLLFKWFGAPWLTALIVVLFGLSFWGPYVHALGGATNLAALYAFVVGVFVHGTGARIAAAIRPRWAEPVMLLTMLVFCMCGFKKQTAPILMIECLSTAMFVVLAVWHSAVKIFNPLDLKLVRFYGKVSYSFYLLHMLGIVFASRLVEAMDLHVSGWSAFSASVLMTFVAVLLTTPLAYLSWRFIELPFIALGRHLGASSATTFAVRRS
jgi:peptidoglycan/LPS O-acetylase OafA/YrhL